MAGSGGTATTGPRQRATKPPHRAIRCQSSRWTFLQSTGDSTVWPPLRPGRTVLRMGPKGAREWPMKGAMGDQEIAHTYCVFACCWHSALWCDFALSHSEEGIVPLRCLGMGLLNGPDWGSIVLTGFIITMDVRFYGLWHDFQARGLRPGVRRRPQFLPASGCHCTT